VVVVDVCINVAAASVFCAPGITLQKDPGQASSSSKQHKGDDRWHGCVLYFV